MAIDISRRNFFRKTRQKLTETVINEIDNKINAKASRWIRPPFAIDELEFFLSCTRCNACVEACEYNAIFPLPEKYGPQAAGTPALDLVDNACHLCKGWPCVSACVPGALTLLDDKSNQPVVKLANVEIDKNSCIAWSGPECGACEGACPVENTLQFIDFKPVINQSTCVGCALCRSACVQDPVAISVYSVHVSTEN